MKKQINIRILVHTLILALLATALIASFYIANEYNRIPAAGFTEMSK
jgi:hypothetical protein